MKVFATRYIDRYAPGDEVTGGPLREQWQYYRESGCVRVEHEELPPGGSVASTPGETTALSALTVAELRERARAAGISGYSAMRKADLVEALR